MQTAAFWHPERDLAYSDRASDADRRSVVEGERSSQVIVAYLIRRLRQGASILDGPAVALQATEILCSSLHRKKRATHVWRDRGGSGLLRRATGRARFWCPPPATADRIPSARSHHRELSPMPYRRAPTDRLMRPPLSCSMLSGILVVSEITDTAP